MTFTQARKRLKELKNITDDQRRKALWTLAESEAIISILILLDAGEGRFLRELLLDIKPEFERSENAS